MLIHSKCNSLYLPTPNSLSIPLAPLSLLTTTSLFSMSLSLFLFCSSVLFCHRVGTFLSISKGINENIFDVDWNQGLLMYFCWWQVVGTSESFIGAKPLLVFYGTAWEYLSKLSHVAALVYPSCRGNSSQKWFRDNYWQCCLREGICLVDQSTFFHL